MSLVVVGSVAIDDVATPSESRKDLLGGSASYACAAASFFAKTGMVGIVGSDFSEEYLELYRRLGIDTSGLAVEEGSTFRWSGVYEDNMIERRTLSTDLNVFESFCPELPESYRNTPYLLLGNISPGLQLHVLDQAPDVQFTAADTMDLWIRIDRDALMKVISKVDLLTLNDGEARLLTGEWGLRDCARVILELGPEYVVIKKGEHGAMLFSKDEVFIVPAYPVENVMDPTGAGDIFAGATLGVLAAAGTGAGLADVKAALFQGAVVASFGVEDFSLEGLRNLATPQISERFDALKGMTSLG
ncbi:MAG: sugar kinase [Lentisphaerae bacterium]|nr:sugar kinase [Lentisphaerota bacterium]